MNSHEIILQTGRDTLRIEMETIRKLYEELNEPFVACVEAIFHAKGRLVVTGVGKSAIVAQKIVATLNSTGTPALFMHAADAIHGDVGMVQADDIVLCLSKSGETAEIKVLIPLVRHLGNTLIAMTARADSTLATQADYVLLTRVDVEADPNNLAPTASTTAQIALGDALAMALLALRGFSPADFATFHPGGALGKQLYLRVSDLYPRNERPIVSPADKLHHTILEITSKCLGATAVVEEGRLIGIITDGDLRRMLEHTTNLEPIRAEDVMSRQPKTVSANTLAVQALEMMRRHSITQLIVVDDDGSYLGFVHLHDLIREGLI